VKNSDWLLGRAVLLLIILRRSSNETLAPQAGQRALCGNVLCIGDCSMPR